MALSSEMAASGAVREAIDLRRFPWVRPLVGSYAYDFASVAPLFAGNPADPDDWRRTIERVQRGSGDRRALVALLARQLQRRGAPAAAQAAVGVLEDSRAVAVLTGQQAGVFGGPLYTVLKAVTALQLARRVREEHGTPAVAVFWVDEEDHDWDEIRTAHILDADVRPRQVTVRDVAGARSHTISSLTFDAGISDAIAELEQLLPQTEFTADVIGGLRRHYCPGVGVSTAFAGWLERLLGHHGLIVFQSADPATKALVGDLFVRELEHPGRTVALARDAGAEMARLGHAPQVEPADDSVGVFYLDEAGRHAIKRRGTGYVIGETARTAQDLVDESRSSPERFSPNVLLRPLVQDRLFPTVCYVSGPSELAYQAQLKGLYREFGVELPLLYPRGSATLLDSASAKFLLRHHLPLEALHVQDDSTLNKLLGGQLPPSIEQALDETREEIARRGRGIMQDIVQVDPTLKGAVDSTVERMQEVLKTLHHKIIQATKRKDDTLRRQYDRTRNLTFPDGHQQERELTIVFALNRFGFGICDRLLETLPLDTGKHYVLTL